MAGGSNDRIYIRQTAGEDAAVARQSARWVNLADERLGARVVEASDEFYAPAQRMLNPRPANHYFHDDEGMRWVDGWETSRRRREGHEHCVIRLGRRGRITGAAFDTSFFTGNFPLGVELLACDSPHEVPDARAAWHPLVNFTRLSGDAQQAVSIDVPRPYTHVRLNLHPDGGMARLRIFGEIVLDSDAAPAGRIDLAALERGGRIVGCNDAHFGSVNALIAPGPSLDWGKGWETRRRREPGSDWAVIALACPGLIEAVEVDTHYYMANQPERFSLHAASVPSETSADLVLNQAMFWPELLGEHPLAGGSKVTICEGFRALGPVTHVRLNIFPDGGVTRLRLFGRAA